MKKLISCFAAVILVFLSLPFSAKAEGSTEMMKFRTDGTFKIVVFADCQDDYSPDSRMINFMGTALDNEQPDMVIFTGDNVVERSLSRFRTGLEKLLKPLVSRNIPYAYTLGNHDAENVGKSQMHDVYMANGRCLTYNADSNISGFGNCNIPIYSHDGRSMLFNLWLLDSDIDHVALNQLDWFTRTDKAIEQAQGHKINSLVFQHIILPECENFLTPASSSSTGGYFGYLGEHPCPGSNVGEFDVLRSRGDVLGIVTGHDHSNSFVARYKGVDFIQTPGMSFASYGDSNCRGYRVIELNERNTSSYSTHTVKYSESTSPNYNTCYSADNRYFRYEQSEEFISEIRIAQGGSPDSAKLSLTGSGYTVVDYNLNDGLGGEYIYLGYRTTPDYTNAIKDIRFYSASGRLTSSSVSLPVNGKKCTYSKIDVDLNAGAGGDYIYCCYSKDKYAGPAIKSLGVTDNLTVIQDKAFGTLESPNIPADLNQTTSSHHTIYCYGSTADELDITRLKEIYSDFSGYNAPAGISATSRQAFASSLQTINSFFDYLETQRATDMQVPSVEALGTNALTAFAELSVCDISGGYIYGLPSAQTVDTALNYFNEAAGISVEASSDYVGTNSVFSFVYGEAQSGKTVIIRGDTDGDSFYDAQDGIIAMCISEGLLSQNDVSFASFLAADCDMNSAVDAADCELLTLAGIGCCTVSQEIP